MTVATALSLLVLAACVPVGGVGPEPVIAGARVASAPFGYLVTRYEVLGSGPPVVMAHGIGGGSSPFQYRRNAAAVADAGYRSLNRPQDDARLRTFDAFANPVVGEAS